MQKNARAGFAARLVSSPPVVSAAAMIPFFIAAFECIRKLTHEGSTPGDLHTFRDAAIALSQGKDIYNSGRGDYLYPPLIAFLGVPLGWMSMFWAGLVMLILNLASALLSLKLASEDLLERLIGSISPLAVAQVALVTAWLTTDQIRNELAAWETNVWMLLMFILALRWSDRRAWWAGAALGFAFNIKYLPIVFVPYLILRRRWKMLGGFILSGIFFAFLPAVGMGWRADFAALLKSYSGIARLFGFHISEGQSAHTYPYTSLKSISITSAIGRFTNFSEAGAMILAGSFALILFLYWIILYKRRGLAFLQWGPGSQQRAFPYRRLFAVEWTVILLITLAFSPYTNSDHLYLLLEVNCAAAVLVIFGKSPSRGLLLAICAAALFLCHILPPGESMFEHANLVWNRISAVAWCMYVLAFALLSSGIARPGVELTSDLFLPPGRGRAGADSA